MADARVFGEIAVGQMDMRKSCLRLVVDAPANDAHLRRVSQASTFSRNLVLLMGAVNEIVTGFAERDQIIRAIPAGLSGLDVMDVEDRVFRFALTPLACMPVKSRTHFFFSPTRWLHQDRAIA